MLNKLFNIISIDYPYPGTPYENHSYDLQSFIDIILFSICSLISFIRFSGKSSSEKSIIASILASVCFKLSKISLSVTDFAARTIFLIFYGADWFYNYFISIICSYILLVNVLL